IKPDSESNYNVGTGGNLQPTLVHVGAADIFAKHTVEMTAALLNGPDIVSSAKANAYGVLADTTGNAAVNLHATPGVEVAANASIPGRDTIFIDARAPGIGVFVEAIADGKALSDSDADAEFRDNFEAVVIGHDGATFASHNLDVHAENNRNGFG